MYQQPKKQSEINALYQQQTMLLQDVSQSYASNLLQNNYGLQNIVRQGLGAPLHSEQDSEEVACFKRRKAAQQRQIDVRKKMWKLMRGLSTAE